MLVGNKSDLDERYISFDDIRDKGEELGIRYFETSALPERRETIEEVFTEIAIMLCEQGLAPRQAKMSFKIQP